MNAAGTPDSGAPDAKDGSPRERLERRGARCLSDVDLLSVLLEIPSAKEPPGSIARRILEKVNGSIYNLSRWTIQDLRAENISWTRVCMLSAAFELAKRFDERSEITTKITTAKDVFAFFNKISLALDREKCWVLSLDVKNQVVRFDEVSAGTATGSLFHPRDFLRPAVRCNASSIILVHNHPSGDSTPSKGDVEITLRLRDAAKVLGINLLDHVIVGRRNVGVHKDGYFSFADAGKL